MPARVAKGLHQQFYSNYPVSQSKSRVSDYDSFWSTFFSEIELILKFRGSNWLQSRQVLGMSTFCHIFPYFAIGHCLYFPPIWPKIVLDVESLCHCYKNKHLLYFYIIVLLILSFREFVHLLPIFNHLCHLAFAILQKKKSMLYYYVESLCHLQYITKIRTFIL